MEPELEIREDFEPTVYHSVYFSQKNQPLQQSNPSSPLLLFSQPSRQSLSYSPQQSKLGKSLPPTLILESILSQQQTQNIRDSKCQNLQLLRNSKWIDKLSLECKLQLGDKSVSTVCHFEDDRLQFVNTGVACDFSSIIKIKINFKDYQKSMWLTTISQVDSNKVQTKLRVFIQNDGKDDLYMLFAKIILEKLSQMDYHIKAAAKQDPTADVFLMKGLLYKKSQVLGQWHPRIVVITDRIESYKNDKCTFMMTNIKQIWTRFEIYQEKLVLKLRHGMDKTELALPLVNYPQKFCKQNWLYRIYRLVAVSVN